MPELRKLYQGQRSLPKDEGVPAGPQRKTMLHDPSAPRFNIAINGTEKLGGIGIHAGHD